MTIAELQRLLKDVPESRQADVMRLYMERAELLGVRQAVTSADIQPYQNVDRLPFDFAGYLHRKRVVLAGRKSPVEDAVHAADILACVNERESCGRPADIIYWRGHGRLALGGVVPACVWLRLDKVEGDTRRLLRKKRIPTYFFLDTHYKNHNPWGPQYEWSNIFMKRYGFYPLLGTLALHHLTLFSPREITVTGMDCYKGKLKELEESSRFLTHNPALDKLCFEETRCLDSRVNVIWPI